MQPLNELAEREVTTQEIEEILKQLDQINKDLKDQEHQAGLKGVTIQKLEDDVE